MKTVKVLFTITVTFSLFIMPTVSCSDEPDNAFPKKSDIGEKPYYKEIELGEVEIPDEWDLSGDEIPYGLIRSHADSLAYKMGEKHFLFGSGIEEITSGLSSDGMPTSAYEVELYDVTGNKASYCFLYYFGEEPLESLDTLARDIYDTGSPKGLKDVKNVHYLKGYIAPISYDYDASGMSSGTGTWILWKPFADDIADDILGISSTFVRFIGPENLKVSEYDLIGYEYTNGERTIIIDITSIHSNKENWVYYDSEYVYENPEKFSYVFEGSNKSMLQQRRKTMKKIWEANGKELTEKGLHYLYDDSRSGPKFLPDHHINHYEYYDFPQIWWLIWDDRANAIHGTHGTWDPIETVEAGAVYTYGECWAIALARTFTYHYEENRHRRFDDPWVPTGSCDFEPGETIIAGFYQVAGMTLAELQANADAARASYVEDYPPLGIENIKSASLGEIKAMFR